MILDEIIRKANCYIICIDAYIIFCYRWFHLFNSKLISNVTVVIIDGWDLSDLTSIISDQEEPPEKKKKVSEQTSPNVTPESNLYQAAEEGSNILERVQESLPYSSACFPLKLQVTPPTEEPVVELFSSVSMSVDIVKSIVKSKMLWLLLCVNYF